MEWLAAISGFIKLILAGLGLIKDQEHKVEIETAKEDGKREIAADNLEAIEKSRQERAKVENEVKNMDNATVDKSLTSWMRH